MTAFLTNWAMQTWSLLLSAAPWLLVGFVLAGAVYVLLPVDKVTRDLGGPGIGAILKASLVGIPLPLCSCSVIPVVSAIRRQGASKGACVSFLVSTPETGLDSIAISYALLGPFLTVIRPLAAFVTAMTAGFLVGRGDVAGESTRAPGREGSPSHGFQGKSLPGSGESAEAPDFVGPGSAGGSCDCAEAGGGTWMGKFGAAFRYGLVEMVADLSPWLVGGFILAGLASAAIPDDFLGHYVGSGLPAMLVMLVVGMPLYVCSTSSTPVAAALIALGLSPGAALVFLLAGPATNMATMLVVARELGRREFALYVAVIAVVAVVFGLAVDAASPALPASLASIPYRTDHSATVVTWPIAVAMILLILNGLRLRVTARRKEKRTCDAPPPVVH